MKHKNILLLVVFLLSVVIAPSTYAQDKASKQAEIKWYTFEEAVKMNKKNPKKIFVDVYTDWCGWCKKMDASTFMDSAVVAYMNENFYSVKFNAEQKEPVNYKGQVFVNPAPEKPKSPHQLAISLLQQELRYPSYVILDGKNEWVYKVKGYKVASDFLPLIKYYGDDKYKTMSWTEYNQPKTL